MADAQAIGAEFLMQDSISQASQETSTTAEDMSAAAQMAMATSDLPNANDDGSIDSANIEAALAQAQVGENQTVALGEQQAPAEQQKKVSRYTQRVQQLVSEKKELAERAARYEAQLQSQAQALHQQQQAFMQRQLEIEQKRLDMEQARQRAIEESQLPDIEKARRKFLAEAQQQVAGSLESKFATLEQQLQQERAWRQQLTEQAEKRERFAQIDAMGKEVLDKHLLAGYKPEDAAAIREEMEEMLHAYSGAFRQLPAQVAPKFQQFVNKLVAAEMNKRAIANSRLAQTRGMPAPLPGMRATTGNVDHNAMLKSVNVNQLRKNGFDNHLAWQRAGYPALTKK